MPSDDHGARRQLGAALRSVGRGPRETAVPVRSFDTTELFGGDTEIEITHQHTVYRLKITRQGKLILNK